MENKQLVDEEGVQYDLSCGVPQESILGPLLWNIYFDRMARTETADGANIFCYVDDTTKSRKLLKRRAEIALHRVTKQEADTWKLH